MPEEIELKLALAGAGAARLKAHSLLAGQPARRAVLSNTYYDTPEGRLEAERVALRIRRTPEGTLQTLKTAGRGSGGFSRRGEWEWAISDGGLDLDGLAQLPPMQALGRPTLRALEPRFTTDFERHSWRLDYAAATIEVALDQGEIRAGERCIAIGELELELKDGPSAALWELAVQLAEQVPMRPANTSKAARGTALREGHWAVPAPGASLQARFDHVISLLDAQTDTGDDIFLFHARDSLLTMANDAAISSPAREHAHAMASALALPDWLTTAFGRHSLALQIALQTA